MTAVLFAAAIIAITHVTVIDTEKGVAIADMNVVIDGDRITAVDKTPPPKGAQVVDGRFRDGETLAGYRVPQCNLLLARQPLEASHLVGRP